MSQVVKTYYPDELYDYSKGPSKVVTVDANGYEVKEYKYNRIVIAVIVALIIVGVVLMIVYSDTKSGPGFIIGVVLFVAGVLSGVFYY